MIKNIPNKYSKELLMQDINMNNKGTYDFFYLPIDFKVHSHNIHTSQPDDKYLQNKCNVGYAFINFIDPRYIRNFYLEFNGKKWERFKSEKVTFFMIHWKL